MSFAAGASGFAMPCEPDGRKDRVVKRRDRWREDNSCGAVSEVPAKPTPEELGFVDRANVPVGEMRRSIHRSHRGEGHNFVD